MANNNNNNSAGESSPAFSAHAEFTDIKGCPFYPPAAQETNYASWSLPSQSCRAVNGASELCENFIQYYLEEDFCSDDEDVLGKTVPMRLDGLTSSPYYLFVPQDILETDGIYIVQAVFKKLFDSELPDGVLKTLTIGEHVSATFRDLVVDGAVWYRWTYTGVGGSRRNKRVTQGKAPQKKKKTSAPAQKKAASAGPVRKPQSLVAGPPRSNGSMPLMSKCAMKFAAACADPFNPAARGACCPNTPCPPSQKVTVFARFVASVGTAGVGAVWIQPCLANDAHSFMYTSAIYVGTLATGATLPTLAAANTYSTGVIGGFANMPYTSSQLATNFSQGGAQVSGRILSVGLRVQYTGTQLNMSGLVHCYIDATHSNVSAMGTAEIDSTTVGVIEPNSREPCMLVSSAMSTQETEYPEDAYTANTILSIYPWSNAETTFSNIIGTIGGALTMNPGTGILEGAPCGIVVFQGVAGTTVFAEYIAHCEYTGPLTQSNATPSDADPEGSALVQAAIAIMPVIRQAASGKKKSNWGYFTDALRTVYKEVKPIAVPLLEAGLTALFV